MSMQDMAFRKALGDVMRARRDALDVSQEELASRAGVHRTYLGSIERGERNVSLQNMLLIAEALRCRLSDLIRDAESTESDRQAGRIRQQ